jgi:hypothetical protein
MDRIISRRELLSTAAFGCAGVVVGIASATPKARAFTLEQASQPVAAQYLAAQAACSRDGDPYHAQIIADMRAQLAREHLSANQQERIISGMTCPLCGCRLG